MKDHVPGRGTVEWCGVSYRTILQAAGMSIVDSVTPAGEGPSRHVHANEDEIFVTLTGEIELWLEGNRRLIGPGEAALVPKGMEHTFRVLGAQPSRHLVILTPGGFESFFVEMAVGGYQLPEQMEQIAAIAERYGLTFTGPPLEDE